MSNVIDIRSVQQSKLKAKPRISVSLRNVSRECRHEILRSNTFQRYWLGKISRSEYVEMLQLHYTLRSTLESLLTSHGSSFHVSNQFDNTSKSFSVQRYVTEKRCKSVLLKKDIDELACSFDNNEKLNRKTVALIRYMHRVDEVYSAALIGILYMFEEVVTYAGPQIANRLDKNLSLDGRATHYLQGADNQKADLWEFRQSLDHISDFQTQANIVTASTMTYRMYQDLMQPVLHTFPRNDASH